MKLFFKQSINIGLLCSLIFFSCEERSVRLSDSLDIETDDIGIVKDYSANLRLQNQEEDIVITNGIIHFKSLEVFQEMRKKSIVELKELFPSYASFDSKEDKFERLNVEANKITSKNEISFLLDKYKNVAEQVGDEVKISDESIYDRFIPDSKNPYFFVGKVIYIYKSGFQFNIIDGDSTKIKRVLNGEKNIPLVGEINIKGMGKNFRGISSTCANMEGVFTTHNNYRGTSWAHSFPAGDPTGIIIGGQMNLRMYLSMNTGGQVQRKLFGVWFNSNTDKTVYINHYAHAYLDGNQVINQYVNSVSTTSGTPENRVFVDLEAPQIVYLLANEAYRYTVNLTEGTGRLSSSSLSGASVWYKCP